MLSIVRVVLFLLVAAAMRPVGAQAPARSAPREPTMNDALRQQLGVAFKQRSATGGLSSMEAPDRPIPRVLAVLLRALAAQEPAPLVGLCPMPVARVDQRTLAPMPVWRLDSTRFAAMRLERGPCVNPLDSR